MGQSPSKSAKDTLPALIYMHGSGFIVGSLDQSGTAMRQLCKGVNEQVYAGEHKLAPEYHWPVRIEEGEFVVRWQFDR